MRCSYTFTFFLYLISNISFQILILLMTSNDNRYMHFFWRKKKAIKKKKITDSGEYSGSFAHKQCHCWAQNKENKIFKIKKHSNRNPRHFIATLKKRGGRRWIKQQICQLNTMQPNWKRSYSNYTQPVKSASHHQRRANHSKHLMQQETNQNKTKKRVGSPPNRIHIIQKKKEE